MGWSYAAFVNQRHYLCKQGLGIVVEFIGKECIEDAEKNGEQIV